MTMVNIRLLPLLLLLVYPLCISGYDNNALKELRRKPARDKGQDIKKLKSMVAYLTGLVEEQARMFKTKLAEHNLLIEWALTESTLAAKNTSVMMKTVTKQIEGLRDELKEDNKCDSPKIDLPASCAEINGGDAEGVHYIYPKRERSYRVSAYCENTAGGGWTVIQKRINGSVDFYRDWEEYAEGFGDVDGEYWLGLRKIHALTKAQPMEIYFGMEDFYDGFLYAKYSNFSVASQDEKFQLRIGNYSGNATNCMRLHNGQLFSTKDQDNDSGEDHDCAARSHGGWWYKSCYFANPNGIVYPEVKIKEWKSINWSCTKVKGISLKSIFMMIRPANFKP